MFERDVNGEGRDRVSVHDVAGITLVHGSPLQTVLRPNAVRCLYRATNTRRPNRRRGY
jgi:hypothetical protein